MEAAGNFVLVFAFGVAIATHSWFAPLLIGAPLVAMVCARNRVPTAFYNPSLSFAMLMRRRIAIRDALAFWVIQSGSGLSAATLVWCDGRSAAPGDHRGDHMNGYTLGAAVALELALTLALCLMAFEVSTSNSRTSKTMTTTRADSLCRYGERHRYWRRHQGCLRPRPQLRRRCAWNFLLADAMDLRGISAALGNRRHDHIREPRRATMSHTLAYPSLLMLATGRVRRNTCWLGYIDSCCR